MYDFLLEQVSKVRLWYASFILLEFVIPIFFLNVNIPTIERLTRSISSGQSSIMFDCLKWFALAQLAYEILWRLRDLLKIKCSIAFKKNSITMLTKKILSFDQTFFMQHNTEITGSVRNIGDSVGRLYILGGKVFRYLAFILFTPIKIFQINGLASLVSVVWIAIWLASSAYIFLYISRDAVNLSGLRDKMLGTIEDAINNIECVSVYKTHHHEEITIRRRLSHLIKCDSRMQMNFWKSWVLQCIYIIFACILILTAFRYGSLNVASFIVLYKVISDLIEMMWASSEHICDFIEHYGNVKDGLNTVSTGKVIEIKNTDNANSQEDAIVFDRVKLTQGQITFQFDAVIQKDTFVALVGQSGSGKSTFAKLILNLYQPDEGQVLNTITDYSFAYAPQRITIFKSTLRYNVCYGIESHITDQEIEDILVSLGCESLLKARVGLNAIIDANTLSAGEIQKLSVARAILADAEVTVFDEPTSLLDLKSEQIVMDTIYRLRKTKIVIAHKINTIKWAQQIIVFDGGQIVAKGSHASLQENKYYKVLQ